MTRLTVLTLAVVALCVGCDYTLTIRVPDYCPVSDSAWAKKDSVPAICVLAKDTTP